MPLFLAKERHCPLIERIEKNLHENSLMHVSSNAFIVTHFLRYIYVKNAAQSEKSTKCSNLRVQTGAFLYGISKF